MRLALGDTVRVGLPKKQHKKYCCFYGFVEDCSADFKLVYLRLRTVGGAAVYGWVWLLDPNAEKAGGWVWA